MADQRYDEQQIGAILQRAAEIQSGLAPETDAQGLTLTELQKVASEVGIEPHIVERAAKEVAAGESKTVPGMLDQTVPGEITEEQWEDAVMSMRQFVGKPGTSTHQGSTREWTGGWDVGHATLTASTRNSQTRFRMIMDMSGLGVLAWLVSFVLGFFVLLTMITVAKKTSVTFPEAFVAGVLLEVLLVFATRFWIRRWQKKTNQKVAELFQSVVQNASGQEPALKAAEPAQEPAVQRLFAE